jgi:hypothetical protein
MTGPISHVDAQDTFMDDEELVGLFVFVPDKISLDLAYLDQVIVDLADDLRRPTLGEQAEFGIEIDWLEFHENLLHLINRDKQDNHDQKPICYRNAARIPHRLSK